MRKCASGGQSLANAELGVGLSVPVQKIKFSINLKQLASLCVNDLQDVDMS